MVQEPICGKVKSREQRLLSRMGEDKVEQEWRPVKVEVMEGFRNGIAWILSLEKHFWWFYAILSLMDTSVKQSMF